MDLSVWSDIDLQLPNLLPHSTEWKAYGEEWAFEGNGWQVLVLKGDEQPDKQILKKFPAASKVIYVTLEPIGAGKDGYKMLEDVVRSLAKSTGGVWVDPNGVAYFYSEGQFQ